MTLGDVIDGEVARGTLLPENVEGLTNRDATVWHHEFLTVRRGQGPEVTACLVNVEGQEWMLHVMGDERRMLPWREVYASGLNFVRWIDG